MQQTVVEALGEIGASRETALLAKKLGDPSWEMQKLAAEVLETLGDVQAVQPLITTLEDMHPTVRRQMPEN